VDAVVFSGDCINSPFKNNLDGFLKLAKTLKYPWYATVGNHDVRFGGEISKDLFFKNMSENNSDMPKLENITYYASKPMKGYKILFLDAVITDRVTSLGYFPEEELKWLDKELSDSPDDKFILVQHHPVVPCIKSTDHYVLNAEQYLNVIDKHKNVVAVMSGISLTRVTERNNVLHISTPALVQYPTLTG
jgi:3',5'-cyclic AMP phosphodiesterase CpdA